MHEEYKIERKQYSIFVDPEKRVYLFGSVCSGGYTTFRKYSYQAMVGANKGCSVLSKRV